MDNKLELYHSILFLKQRPLRTRNNPQIKYKELLKELKYETYKYQPSNEVDFLPPHTDKARYYRALIKNEAIRYYNHINDIISNSTDTDVKQLWIKSTLNDVLSVKLFEVAKEIERLNYSINNIDTQQNHKLKNASCSEETYIYQFLKVQLIQLYLDIQEKFEQYLLMERLSEEDIYLTFFKEAPPHHSFIKESEKIELPIPKVKLKEKSSFKTIYSDIKPSINSDIDYNNINNQKLFGEVEIHLYEYGIIDIDYYFKKNKQQQNHTLLAAIYRVLIDNNYFRRNIIGSHKKAKDIDIRKYLDERYSTDTSQQFRKLTDAQVEKAKRNLLWLDKITPIS